MVNQFSRNVALWLVLGLMFLLLFNLFNKQQAKEPEVIFSDFVSSAEKGEVAEVTIQGHNIRGKSHTGERFKTLQLTNITQMVGDGAKGWPNQAPFDRIIVTAAATEIPPALLEQLAEGGIMIIPLESSAGKQDLVRVTRTAEGYDRETLLPVRFVPLVEGVAKES